MHSKRSPSLALNPWWLNAADAKIIGQAGDPNTPFGKFPRVPRCFHCRVPFVKSHYSDELVQRGVCPDCGTHCLELD
jgi:hypothetical protein